MKIKLDNLTRNLLLTAFMSLTLFLPANIIASEITREGYHNVTAKEAMQIINTYQNVVILDVRDHSGFDSGHLTGALSLPLLEFEKGISNFKKGMTFIVYCQNGEKSRVASTKLMEKGFISVFNLVSGINEWQVAGYSVTGKDVCSTCPKHRPSGASNNKNAQIPATFAGYCVSYGGSHEFESISKVSYKVMSEGVLSVTVIIYIANPTGCVYGQPCPEYDESPEYINAWIDWNGNKVFESGERVLNAALTGYLGINYYGTMSTSNIVNVPSGAVNSTFMRVNLGWDYDPNDPCTQSWTWGDVTDQPVELSLNPPKIDEITVTGIPDAINPMTSDPSLAGTEEVNLQAKITESPDYQITDTDWTGDVTAGKGNPYKYTAGTGSHGKKKVTCTITYKNKVTNVVGTNSLSKDFFLFFNKSGDDDGNGEPNWFRYWKTDGPVPNMGVAKYDASLSGYGLMTGAGDLYLSPTAAGQHYSRPIVVNSSFGTESFGGPTVKGIDCTAEIIAHELYHKWVNGQWQAGGTFSGTTDSDRGVQAADCNDRLPDFYETATSKTKNDDTDTYDLEHLKSATYRTYGDNEYMAMRAGNGARGDMAKDWANPGKQTTPLYDNDSPLKSLSAASDPAYASFTGVYSDSGVDTNTDGLFDYLKVATGINVTSAGSFNLVARLNDNTLKEITFYNKALTLSQGVQTIDITFDGLKIREKAINGPYKVTFLITNEYGDTLNYKPNAYTTAAYNYTAFKTKPFSFSGKFTDKGKDTNVNSLWDYLSITAEVNITTTGSYLCEGALYDKNGKVIEIQDTLITLQAGTRTVIFDFTGKLISKNRTDGPYYLKYLSISRNNESDFILNAYTTTSTYLFKNFERAAGIFTGNFTISTVDIDHNTRFDSLKTRIGVNMILPGNYTVFGYLFDKNGNQILKANVKKNFNSGDNTVDLSFDGISIYLHGVDGPYYLNNISLQNEPGNSLDAISSADTTNAYKFTDFQKPANPLIELTGNYNDKKSDINADTKYEYLTVDVGVMLSDSGYVVIKARLTDVQNKEIVWAENIAKLKKGTPQVIQLHFRGDSILKHKVNGPYYVRNVYVYHTGDPSQPDYVVNAHTTAAYKYTEFDGVTGITGYDYNSSAIGSFLGDNYPNPVKTSTSINYYIPSNEFVTLTILDASGKEVETLVREYKTEGVHQATWTPKGLPDGIYFCNLKFGNKNETKKLFLSR